MSQQQTTNSTQPKSYKGQQVSQSASWHPLVCLTSLVHKTNYCAVTMRAYNCNSIWFIVMHLSTFHHGWKPWCGQTKDLCYKLQYVLISLGGGKHIGCIYAKGHCDLGCQNIGSSPLQWHGGRSVSCAHLFNHIHVCILKLRKIM